MYIVSYRACLCVCTWKMHVYLSQFCSMHMHPVSVPTMHLDMSEHKQTDACTCMEADLFVQCICTDAGKHTQISTPSISVTYAWQYIHSWHS
jgi:hypothetical protein